MKRRSTLVGSGVLFALCSVVSAQSPVTFRGGTLDRIGNTVLTDGRSLLLVTTTGLELVVPETKETQVFSTDAVESVDYVERNQFGWWPSGWFKRNTNHHLHVAATIGPEKRRVIVELEVSSEVLCPHLARLSKQGKLAPPSALQRCQ